DGAGEDGELQIAEVDFAAQGLGQLLFEHRAKSVGVDQEGQREGGQEQEGDDRASDESDAFHRCLRVYYLRDALQMTRSGKILASAIALLLAACLAAVWLTRDAAPIRTVAQASLVDRRLLETARQAARLADHELDQAFATAVREAADFKPATSGPVQQLNVRVAQAKARLAADQARIAKLAKDAETSDRAAGQLELAKAQLALDEDAV